MTTRLYSTHGCDAVQLGDLPLVQARLLVACAAYNRVCCGWPGITELRAFFGMVARAHVEPLVRLGLIERLDVRGGWGHGRTVLHVLTQAGWDWIGEERMMEAAE